MHAQKSVHCIFHNYNTLHTHTVYIAPSPPADVSVSQSGVNSVLVSWSPPSGEPAVTGYIIYYWLFGRERLSQRAGPTANNATITGLIAGSYYITMVATSSTLPSAETAVQSIALGNSHNIFCLPRIILNAGSDLYLGGV